VPPLRVLQVQALVLPLQAPPLELELRGPQEARP